MKSSEDLLPGVHRAVRGRAVLPGSGRGGLQTVLQQRELRGLSVRVRAVAALLRVFLSACFGARQSFRAAPFFMDCLQT